MAVTPPEKLRSRGPVVIPEEAGNDLGINGADQFVVIGRGDIGILKVIPPPKLEEFHELLSQARAVGKKVRVNKAQLKSAIAKVRRNSK